MSETNFWKVECENSIIITPQMKELYEVEYQYPSIKLSNGIVCNLCIVPENNSSTLCLDGSEDHHYEYGLYLDFSQDKIMKYETSPANLQVIAIYSIYNMYGRWIRIKNNDYKIKYKIYSHFEDNLLKIKTKIGFIEQEIIKKVIKIKDFNPQYYKEIEKIKLAFSYLKNRLPTDIIDIIKDYFMTTTALIY